MTFHQPDWGSGESFLGPRHRFRERLIVKTMPPPEGTVLDVACGLGTLAERLTSIGHHVVGADQDIGAALQTKDRGIPAILARMEHLPFRDNVFSVTVTAETLEHIHYHLSASDELFRVLQPGGSVVATVPAHERMRSDWDRWAGHVRRYALPDLLELFHRFVVIRILGFGFPFLRLYDRWILRRIIMKRQRKGDHSSGFRHWFFLRKYTSGILFLLFCLQIPSTKQNVGWLLHMLKPKS